MEGEAYVKRDEGYVTPKYLVGLRQRADQQTLEIGHKTKQLRLLKQESHRLQVIVEKDQKTIDDDRIQHQKITTACETVHTRALEVHENVSAHRLSFSPPLVLITYSSAVHFTVVLALCMQCRNYTIILAALKISMTDKCAAIELTRHQVSKANTTCGKLRDQYELGNGVARICAEEVGEMMQVRSSPSKRIASIAMLIEQESPQRAISPSR